MVRPITSLAWFGFISLFPFFSRLGNLGRESAKSRVAGLLNLKSVPLSISSNSIWLHPLHLLRPGAVWGFETTLNFPAPIQIQPRQFSTSHLRTLRPAPKNKVESGSRPAPIAIQHNFFLCSWARRLPSPTRPSSPALLGVAWLPRRVLPTRVRAASCRAATCGPRTMRPVLFLAALAPVLAESQPRTHDLTPGLAHRSPVASIPDIITPREPQPVANSDDAISPRLSAGNILQARSEGTLGQTPWIGCAIGLTCTALAAVMLG